MDDVKQSVKEYNDEKRTRQETLQKKLANYIVFVEHIKRLEKTDEVRSRVVQQKTIDEDDDYISKEDFTAMIKNIFSPDEQEALLKTMRSMMIKEVVTGSLKSVVYMPEDPTATLEG